MAMRELMPRGRGRGRGRGGGMGSLMGPGDMVSPMLNLRQEIETLFDDMMRGSLSPFTGAPPARMGGSEQRVMTWPNIEITQNENEISIHADVPGLSEDDVELTIEDGVLTIRGEKKMESENQERGYSERYYGQFERRIALPPDVDEDNAEADFNNGVLSITLHKSPQAERARRIPIGGGRRSSAQGQQHGLQQAASGQATGQQQGQQTGQQTTGQQTEQTQGRQPGQESQQKGQQTQKSPRTGREPPTQSQE